MGAHFRESFSFLSMAFGTLYNSMGCKLVTLTALIDKP